MRVGKKLEDVVEEYFAQCDGLGRKYTLEGLSTALGQPSDVVLGWMDGTRGQRRAKILRLARDRMVDAIQQGSSSMDVFRLKQRHYGGYGDKSDGGRATRVTVHFTGGDGYGD